MRNSTQTNQKKDVARSVRLPSEIWKLVDEDARRCCRSSAKQLEALLRNWFLKVDVDIDLGKKAKKGGEAKQN